MEKSLLVDAKMLAAFANLEPADADSFRKAVAPDFVPAGFWAGGTIPISPDATSIRIWQTEQERLRSAWRSNFSLERCLDLILSAAKLSEGSSGSMELTKKC